MGIVKTAMSGGGVSVMSDWHWDHDEDGSMGSRECGHFSAVVISRYGDEELFDYLIFDDRDQHGDPIYESSHLRFMNRQTACNNATRELRWRAESDPSYRMVAA